MKAMLTVKNDAGEMTPEYTVEMKQPKSLGFSDIRQFLKDAAEGLSAEGRTFSTDANPRSYYIKGSGITTWQATGSMHYSSGDMESSIFGGSPAGNDENDLLDGVLDGKPVKFGVDFVPTGVMLAVGKKGTDILGGEHEMYFSKLTAKNFKTSSSCSAKLFDTKKKAENWMKKNEDTLLFVGKKGGFAFSLVDAETGETVESSICDEVNASADGSTPEPVTFGATAKEEAILRMKELGLWDRIISEFKNNGKVFFSEGGGAVYDLEEDMKACIPTIPGLVYHVIKSGPMVSYLYVSENRNKWATERYDRRGEVIPAFVRNDEYPGCSEIGDIGVRPANGGLVRFA